MSNTTGAAHASRAPRFGVLLILLAVLAFAVREQYVLTAIVDNPIRGDIREYVAYAWNLVQHGVFSSTMPPNLPVADDYRMPGYPWLIALGMQLFPQEPTWGVLGGWYPFVQQTQVVLGAATVVLVALLARYWLSATWSIAAGLLLALWPHHIAATNTLLSEIVFGFSLVAALYAFARAWQTKRTSWYVVSALAFGYAYLVNPLILFFPPCLAILVFFHGARRPAAILLGVFLLPVIAVGVRNANIDNSGRGTDRAALNFVQGSWPDYHVAASRVHLDDPIAIAISREIDAEHATLRRDASAGLARMGQRIAGQPWMYARWYAQKPWLLWGWRIQIGSSDIAYHEVRRSPFDRPGALRAILVTYRTLNPLLTTLALIAALALTVVALRRDAKLPAVATGALALYVTLVHVVLQAEPRYAIAYRGLEAILVMTALSWVAGLARRQRSTDALDSTGHKVA